MQELVGWHDPELAKGVISPATTPFASSGTCHPMVKLVERIVYVQEENP